MKVGILGTGDVGRTLGTAFVTLGHQVKMGAREATNEKAAAWAKDAGQSASHGTFADAAGFGDIVVLSTHGTANEAVLKSIPPERLQGKLLIDTTNPLDFSKGMPPRLFVGHTDSGGERVQRAAPEARVVKCWNIVGHTSMFRPAYETGTPAMFICGNDAEAKKQVTRILHDFGWSEVVDFGGIESSRHLEPLCIVWVMYGAATGGWTHAFALLKK
ncbi:MAG TPA: NAD(P)-binding domain-containing protein [Polyangiaceae bacterium]|nr:NAD(P)-binding domain-containing protein [Polyangiaceae bacterium]